MPPPPPPRARADLPALLSRSSIVLFGDSLTQRGFERDGWAAAVADYYGRRADVYNRGYGGYNARWGAELAPALLPPPLPGAGRHMLVTVWFGANDAALPSERAHVPLSEFEAHLDGVVTRAARAAHRVVVVTPPPVHGPTRLAYQRRKYGDKASGVEERTTELSAAYGAAAARVAARRGAALLDVHGLMLQEPDWPSLVGASEPDGDGLHFSPAGQRFVAAKMLDLLKTLGLARENLAYDLPWGTEVDPDAYAPSLRRHFATSRAFLAERSGAALEPGTPGAAAPPEPPAWLRVAHAPATSAFLLGALCGAGALLLFTRRRVRRTR